MNLFIGVEFVLAGLLFSIAVGYGAEPIYRDWIPFHLFPTNSISSILLYSYECCSAKKEASPALTLFCLFFQLVCFYLINEVNCCVCLFGERQAHNQQPVNLISFVKSIEGASGRARGQTKHNKEKNNKKIN